jgi:N-acetylmuramoyl-L-alanine amidase
MKKSVKKVIVVGGVALMVGATLPQQINALECTNMDTDIVIRVGEYPNKPGKRLDNVDKDFDIDVPIRYDNGRYCIQEYDLNYKVANAIVKYLESQGVNVVLQDTQNKSQDLNSAGRKAKSLNPDIYLSIHHNSYTENSSGYFFMSNVGDTKSAQCAKRLSNAMSDNPMLIPQMENRRNVNNYIGELNQKPAKINMLGEFGFFSNPNEVKKCASDEQVEYIAKQLGNELIKILKEVK